MSDMEPSDGSEARYLGNSEDDEDKSDDDAPPPDEDDEDDEEPAKKQQNIAQFYGASSTKRGKAPVRAKSKLLELQESDAESDSEVPTRKLERKPLKIATVAADPFEEHDQLRREYANGAPAKEDDEQVVAKVNTVTDVFLLKNDKGPATKRFFTIDATQSALHAPNYHGTAKCPLTMTCAAILQSRKDREAMLLTVAADAEQLELMAKQLVIFDVKMEGSASGPGVMNVAGFLPHKIVDTDENIAIFQEQYLGEGVAFPTFLVAIDEKLVKKILKKGKFPRMYDSTRMTNVKYRVIVKMEEQCKMDKNIAAFAVPSKGGKRKRVSGVTLAVEKLPTVNEAPEGELRAVWRSCDGVVVARVPCGPKETLTLSGSKGSYILTKT